MSGKGFVAMLHCRASLQFGKVYSSFLVLHWLELYPIGSSWRCVLPDMGDRLVIKGSKWFEALQLKLNIQKV